VGEELMADSTNRGRVSVSQRPTGAGDAGRDVAEWSSFASVWGFGGGWTVHTHSTDRTDQGRGDGGFHLASHSSL